MVDWDLTYQEEVEAEANAERMEITTTHAVKKAAQHKLTMYLVYEFLLKHKKNRKLEFYSGSDSYPCLAGCKACQLLEDFGIDPSKIWG